MPKQPLKHLKLYQNKIMQIHELKSKKDPDVYKRQYLGQIKDQGCLFLDQTNIFMRA